MKIKIIRFSDNLKIPHRAYHNDAGADVFLPERMVLRNGETRKCRLGFGLAIPDGYCGLILPRSSYASRGIISQIPPIDSGYRGEICAIISNFSGTHEIFDAGTRLGQLVILPIVIADFYEGELEERYDSGFGSTDA